MEELVLDSSAVLAFLLGERGGSTLKQELRSCREGKKRAWVSAAGVAEVQRRMRRSMDAEKARRMLDVLLLTPVTVAPLDRELAGRAADLSHEAGIGLFDAVMAATAQQIGATLLTADPDFRRLGARVKMRFVR